MYEATNGPVTPITDMLNKIATDDAANQVSSSWLLEDSQTWDDIYLQFAAQGQSYYQAAGDNGAYNWADQDQQHEDSPYITLVGGTTLTTGSLGSWVSETVWNWNSTGEGHRRWWRGHQSLITGFRSGSRALTWRTMAAPPHSATVPMLL